MFISAKLGMLVLQTPFFVTPIPNLVSDTYSVPHNYPTDNGLQWAICELIKTIAHLGNFITHNKYKGILARALLTSSNLAA
jgi:hypothetical protein